LKLKKVRTIKLYKEGYIEEAEFQGEMAAVELAIRKLDIPEVDGVTYDDVIEAGEHIPGMAALWDVATPEERREMVILLLEPGGLYYDMEQKIIAALKPRPAFLPILRMLNGIVEYDEARGLLLAERWQERNRRATIHRSHLSLVPLAKLFPGRNDILVYNHPAPEQGDPLPHSQRHPGSDPHWKIPVAEWPTVFHRIEQGEPLRKVAGDYNVSYEAVRRVLRAVGRH
jgi:hypothetical protein